MDTLLESKLDGILSRINSLEANQDMMMSVWRWQITDYSGSSLNSWFDISYINWDQIYNVPIASSIRLPSWLKAETNSWSTIITEIVKPDYSMSDESFNNVNHLFFWFFEVMAWMICLWLFAYYYKQFLLYFLIPKK